MSTIVRARRVSPKVRRLAREHDVQLRAVPGTGTGGRVTPRDVRRAVGGPRPTPSGAVLASPLARRLLRDAGIDLAEAARRSGDQPLTRAVAARLADELAGDGDRRSGSAATTSSSPGDGAATTGTRVEVDVAELLALVTAARPGFVARHGFELGLEVPVGAAAASVLTARAGAGGGGVHLGFHSAGDDGVRVVTDVQDLTVAGLARRSRAASSASGDGQPAPTITITTDPEPPVPALVAGADVGVLVLGDHALREARRTDHLGHEVVRTRPHVPVRLHHDGRSSDEEAGALLTALGEAIAGWTRPVDS